MTMATVHVIGAGLSGLSAAVRLADAGFAVRVYEGAGQAGGRARSYFDEALQCTIDNGNHLLLSGNRSAMAYLDLIGSRGSLAGPDDAAFPFYDLKTDERWTVRMSKTALPVWVFDPAARVPGTRPIDYAATLKLFTAGRDATVESVLGPKGALYERFWEPMAVSVLNTPPDRASARLLVPVLLETFGRGAAACRPRIAREGLSESFVTPALSFLHSHGVEVRFGQRLTALETAGDRVSGLVFSRGAVAVEPEDRVVVALPSWVAGGIVPGLKAPQASYPIVNVHYRLPAAVGEGTPSLLGMVGGITHWLFVRGRIASVTVSAAEALAAQDAETIAAKIWSEVARALGNAGMAQPPARVVKERRATFAQDPASLRLRAKTRTQFRNLVLAGDWTDTGLPATIEGAIRSGERAAAQLTRDLGASRSARRSAGATAPVSGHA